MGIFDIAKSIITPSYIDVPDSFHKANVFTPANMDLMKSMAAREPKAHFENPLNLIEAMGYKDKPSPISFTILNRMSIRNSVIAAIILTRVNQVSSFTKPSRYSGDGLGYEIRLRNKEAIATKSQKEAMLAMELFLENCGFNDDPDRDDFDTFIRKIVRDSLVFDQMTFEVVPDRKGRPAGIYAVDASTIRHASEDYDPKEWGGQPKGEKDVVKWVQMINGQVFSWFSAKQLCFGVRNPRADVHIQPYGFSELEQLIHQVTSHLYAEEYNARFFSQGGTTKGILNLKTKPLDSNREQLAAFKRQWRAQVSGLHGAWKTPVLQIPEGIEYLNVSQSNREMEFEKWMNYLINIACHPAGTKIFKDGYTVEDIENIQPNDRVINHTGSVNSVINTQKKLYTGKMYTFTKCLNFLGRTVQATEEHPFLIVKDKYLSEKLRNNVKPDREWVEAKDIETGMYFVAPILKTAPKNLKTIDVLEHIETNKNTLFDDKLVWYKISPRSGEASLKDVAELAGVNYRTLVSSRCTSSGTSVSEMTQHKVNEAYESLGFTGTSPITVNRYIKVDEDFAWLLGVYVAEGCSQGTASRFNLGIKDKERGIVDRLLPLIKRCFGVEPSVKEYNNNINIFVNSKVVQQLLSSLCGEGSPNKVVPDVVMDSDTNIKKAFVEGLTDGDGCIPSQNPSDVSYVTIDTISKKLMSQVYGVLLELGIYPAFNRFEQQDKFDIYSLSFGGKPTYQTFPHWLKPDVKYKSNYLKDDEYFYIRVSSVSSEHVENFPVYNFEVETSHSYLANGIASHNCAVYQIDPAEVNFPNNGGVGGRSGSMFEGSQEGRLKHSKDKGLRPLLRFVETCLNKYLITEFSNDYVFNFTGIDAKTERETIDLDKERVRVFKTVNEIRREHDMEPLEHGDIILDSSYISVHNQAQMGAMGGMGAAGGGQEEEDEDVDYDFDEDTDYDLDDDVDEEWSDEQEETDEEEIEKSHKVIEIIIE